MALTRRPVAADVDELLAGAGSRQPFRPADARSSATFERVELDGERCIVKYVHVDHDFALRSAGDIGCLPLRLWACGAMDVAPTVIDHAVLGAAPWGRNGWGAAIVMRDVGAELVPLGDEPVGEATHVAAIEHLAAMSARMWGWHDDVGLLPYGQRWCTFAPVSVATERDLGYPEPVPRLAMEGWARFAGRVPAALRETVGALHADVGPLAEALGATPSTFIHGDWKFGNLGRAGDGRTVLIDWAYGGEGPVAHELAWYLALNRARLPQGHTKESTIDDLRIALGRHGVDTAPWWDRQLALGLLGAVVQFGWEKAFGDEAELDWWVERAIDGAAML
ncbi:MAG: phosphotransferase [Ilumatobacteraceae bacterium]